MVYTLGSCRSAFVRITLQDTIILVSKLPMGDRYASLDLLASRLLGVLSEDVLRVRRQAVLGVVALLLGLRLAALLVGLRLLTLLCVRLGLGLGGLTALLGCGHSDIGAVGVLELISSNSKRSRMCWW